MESGHVLQQYFDKRKSQTSPNALSFSWPQILPLDGLIPEVKVIHLPATLLLVKYFNFMGFLKQTFFFYVCFIQETELLLFPVAILNSALFCKQICLFTSFLQLNHTLSLSPCSPLGKSGCNILSLLNYQMNYFKKDESQKTH